MKITKTKNKKIIYKSLQYLKPTKSNIKSLFYSQIKNYKKIYTLELFAGTGNMSFDLSNNKKNKSILIEKNRKIYENIKNNKKILKNKNNIQIYLNDSKKWLKHIKIINFSILIIDPPYKNTKIYKYFKKIEKINIIKKYTIYFIESKKKIIFKNFFTNYFLLKKNKKGISKFIIIKNI